MSDTNALKALIRKYGYCGLEREIIHLRDTVMFNPQLEQEELDATERPVAQARVEREVSQ